MTDETLRTFIAVMLGEAAVRAAAAVSDALRRSAGGDAVGWVRAEALHVTLRFLGDVERSLIPGLAGSVGSQVADLDPFEIGLGAALAFPSPRRPRVIALAVAPEPPLAGLAAAVERGVVAAGFEPETRRFRAHLTLGRVRGRRAPDPARVPPPPPSPFQVNEVLLLRSQLGPGGARYTPLERLALRGSTPRNRKEKE